MESRRVGFNGYLNAIEENENKKKKKKKKIFDYNDDISFYRHPLSLSKARKRVENVIYLVK